MNWDHVVAEVSREILTSDRMPTHVELCRALMEMEEAFAADLEDGMVSGKSLNIRERALNALEYLLETNNDVMDEAGEVIGNAGVDKIAACRAIKAFWSDGEAEPVPEVDIG